MTTMNDMSSRTTIVVGASRGLGRGIATAFADAGATVVAVSRTAAAFPEPDSGAGTIQPEVADAGDATVPARLIDRYEPAGDHPGRRRNTAHASAAGTRRGRRSRSTGTPTSGSRSTGCARLCSRRCAPAAGSSWSAAAPR